MPSAFLSSDTTLTNGARTNLLSVSLDPGVWIVLFGMETDFDNTNGNQQTWLEIWDGESTFYGGATVNWNAINETISGDAHHFFQHNTAMAVVDLSAASVATTIYGATNNVVLTGTPSAKAKAGVQHNSFAIGTWLIATPFGEGGGVSFPPAPTTITSGTAHTGLTGSGSFTLTSPNNGIEIDATTIPAGWGFADWSPTHYIPAFCEIAWDASAGIARTDLVHEALTVLFQPYAAANEVFYSIKPGWTLTITEVQGT